ncbi:MAG: sporulation transcription factor Spo0A [Clostridia bacterium]|nr:sporulation transcription factor Spo0A [Clostridia bacterium]
MDDTPIRILIADDNRRFCDILQKSLEAVEPFEVVGMVHDGADTVRMVEQLLPDLLILDMIMPHLDGLGVLEQLHASRLERMPRVIILSGLGQDLIATRALSLGADYYMLKPFDMDVLVRRAQDLMAGKTCSMTRIHFEQRDKIITGMLGQINMSPAIQGYMFLRRAVNMVSVDISLLRGITKRLYPMLAESFDSTPSRVERSIRHAIESTVNKGNMDALHHIFGNTMDPQKGKPTNGEFIAMLAEYVRNAAK